MKNNKTVTAIVLVAGNSTRYGKNRNKNFELINGKTVISYTLNIFDKNDYIDDIIIAVKENEIQEIEKIIESENLNKEVKLIIGGNTRKQSVYNCLKMTNSDIVIIHDGARPAIKQEYIDKCLETMNDFSGATMRVKSKDTIKITDDNNVVVTTTKRKNTWLIQTPQCFERKTLLEMHEKYNDEDITDDCVLLEKGNYQVKIIEGDYTNIKLTTYEDLSIIREFLKNS